MISKKNIVKHFYPIGLLFGASVSQNFLSKTSARKTKMFCGIAKDYLRK